MSRRSLRSLSLGIGLATGLSLAATSASAFPGFFVGKNVQKRESHASFVIVMNHGEQSVVSVLPDYDGPFEPFAMVLAMPSDVTLDRVATLRREFVDRVDQLSAPRFHEFWEADPCDDTPAQQEWERDLRVQAGADNFLGAGIDFGQQKKVAKELLLNVKSEQKSGEYTFSMAEDGKPFLDYAKSRGWVFTPAMEAAVQKYTSEGTKFLLAEVDPNRIELIGGDRAQLSPIRFSSTQRYTKLPSTLGRLGAKGQQELFVFVIDPEKRFEPKNYKTAFPPTNINVDFAVKERLGELYAALHDRFLAKNPTTIWSEYAWGVEGCGQPCPNEPLLINEVLSLGADYFEQSVPDDERNPKPPDLTEDEKKAQKADLDLLKPAERAKKKIVLEDDRKELARRKALLSRHKYVLSRLHHRYDNAGLPTDIELGPAEGGLEGGGTVPVGEKGVLPTDIKPSAANKFQTRFVNFHPWKSVLKCDKPARFRWGKKWREIRTLNKVWVVEDLVRKSRTQIKPEQVVMTPIPSLGLSGVIPKAAPDAGVDGGEEAESGKKGGCGCRVTSSESKSSTALALLLGLAALGLRRRSRS